MAPLVDLSQVNIDEGKSFAIKWVDEAGPRPLAEESADEDDLVNKINPPMIMNHRDNQKLVKSIVKGSKLNLA